jgi:hypothetical protein
LVEDEAPGRETCRFSVIGLSLAQPDIPPLT